jgi:cobalamin biosynthesis protein CobD/CbiB
MDIQILYKKIVRNQIMKTVRFEVGRFTGSAIALLLLGLVATVSIFILKVAFTIAAIGILIKIFSRN